MNLKAVKSREDEKQFKLLYYDFVVKHQFSPQPYCEAAGFQILTALACAARGEEMPGSAEQKHLLSSPAGLLLELGRELPSRWCHCRQETGEALPRRGLEIPPICFQRLHSLHVRGNFKWFSKAVCRLPIAEQRCSYCGWMSMTVTVGSSSFRVGGMECFMSLNSLHPQMALLERCLYNHPFGSEET